MFDPNKTTREALLALKWDELMAMLPPGDSEQCLELTLIDSPWFDSASLCGNGPVIFLGTTARMTQCTCIDDVVEALFGEG